MKSVRITVASTLGSTPREAGASMLVDATGSHGTIGGGHLEWMAIRQAREMMLDGQAVARCQRFSLGASLGQCCGGVVELWFEPAEGPARPAARWRLSPAGTADASYFAQDCDLPEWVQSLQAGQPAPPRAQLVTHQGQQHLLESLLDDRTPLYLYGAGHIANAMQPMLASLPFSTVWIDNRDGCLPVQAAGNVTPLPSDDPVAEALLAPAGAFHLVMTHDHSLDYSIVHALLAGSKAGFVGMIGSQSKRARFMHRLEARGVSAQQRASLCCPIGVAQINDKSPMAIAVSCCAQLLQLRTAAQRAVPPMQAG